MVKNSTINALRAAWAQESTMRIMDIDLDQYERIARSTSEESYKDRWTECEVYWHPSRFPRFIARSLGKSRIAGERTKERRMPGGSLQKALKLFDNDTIVEGSAISQAEAHMAQIFAQPCPEAAPAARLTVPRYPTDEMMNAGLYHCSADMTWSDLFTAWTAMFDAIALDGGLTTELPAEDAANG